MSAPSPAHQRPTQPSGGASEFNVILTGFMATGKSSVGRLLAERLGSRWVDTDELIEARYGPIPTIFAHQGEEAFRGYEREIAEELSGQRRLVVSTGGRLMLDPANARLLAATGPVFCLVASPATIARRLRDQKGSNRPLLNGADVRHQIKAILAERAEGYARFPRVVTDRKTVQAVADEIVDRLKEHGDHGA